MIYSKYLVLICSIYSLYYFIWKYKQNNYLRFAALFASSGGLLVSIALILEELDFFPKEIIHTIIRIPIFLLVFLMFLMLVLNSWKKRNEQKERAKLYVFAGAILFSLLLFITLFWLLPLFGIWK